MIQMRVSSNKSPALQILKKSRAHFSSVSHSTVRLKPKLAVTTQRVRSSTCSADHGPSPTHACLYHSILTTDYNKLCRALYMDTKGNTSILRVHCTSPSFFYQKNINGQQCSIFIEPLSDLIHLFTEKIMVLQQNERCRFVGSMVTERRPRQRLG